MMRTSNPILSDRVFTGTAHPALSDHVMTLDGTVNKTLISIAITTAAAYWTWHDPKMLGFMFPAVIAGLVLGLIISFKKTWAPLLTPVYAAVEGVFLGAVSLAAQRIYPGIVFQAVSLTLGVLICLLMAYKSGIIKPSENFKLGVAAATGGIFVIYLVSMILSLFGVPVTFLHNASPLSIGISVVVVIIAALNLVLDFDFIENAARTGNTPKYMEWYGAFGLLVTLIWLYLEILRLLSKLNERR